MKQLLTAVSIALIAIAGLIFGIQEFAAAQSQAKCYLEAGAAKAVATSGCEYEFQSGSTLDIQSGVVMSNAGFEQLTAQAAISVTDGSVVTPTGSYQPLESGGAVTATLSNGCTAGRRVTFINTVAQAIIISETATSALSGNATLNQYDAMMVLCDGTRWVQVAPESDN